MNERLFTMIWKVNVLLFSAPYLHIASPRAPMALPLNGWLIIWGVGGLWLNSVGLYNIPSDELLFISAVQQICNIRNLVTSFCFWFAIVQSEYLLSSNSCELCK